MTSEPNQNHHVLLALGSNLGDREAHLREAISRIDGACGTVKKVSSLFETVPLPVPNVEQGCFLNMALSLSTALEPSELLNALNAIEADLGRDRKSEVHWGPRTIDIDMIDFDGMLLESDDLTLPHPRLSERDFVLLPLKEIAPEFTCCRSKLSADALLANIPFDMRTAFKKIPFSLNLTQFESSTPLDQKASNF